MFIVIYMKLLWCNGFPEMYAQLEEGVGSICHRYMYIVLYIYDLQVDLTRSAKFCVAVFKASMLDWGVTSASRSAKLGVVVFKASMLN